MLSLRAIASWLGPALIVGALVVPVSEPELAMVSSRARAEAGFDVPRVDVPPPEPDENGFVPFPPGVGPGSPADDAPGVVGIDEQPLVADMIELPAPDDNVLTAMSDEDAAEPAAEPRADGNAKREKRNDPIGDFFKPFFPQGEKRRPDAVAKPPNRPAVDRPNEKQADPGRTRLTSSRLPSDTRIAFDRRAVQWNEQAEEAVGRGAWSEAAKLYQQVLDRPDDSFHRTTAGEWVPLRRHVHRRLLQGPSGLRDAYETEVGGLAARLLREGLEVNSEEAVAVVAARYFATAAGLDAANRVASIAFDRGQIVLAAYWYRELWLARAPITRTAKWRLRAAVALERAKQGKLALEILDAAIEAGEARPGKLVNSEPAAAWLTSLARSLPAWSAPQLTDWPVPFGNASRSAHVRGGEPLLVPLWKSPITTNRAALEQIEQIVQSLQDQATPTLLAGHVLATRGKVIHRTLSGVRVVDAKTGRLLWQTDDEFGLEAAIALAPRGFDEMDQEFEDEEAEVAANPPPPPVLQLIPQPGRPLPFDNTFAVNAGQDPQNHPLSNLLFRNAAFGSVSTYGTRLFVLSDRSVFDPRQPGQAQGWDGRDDTYGVGNVLTAYDLDSGRMDWEVGGDGSEDGLELPLASSYFFGPPLAVDGELLVVAEREKDIRLLALDPANGRVNWSLLLGHSDAKIAVDLGRRWWTAPVASGDGVLVCPTTAGFVLGVDRLTRSVLWAYRLSKPPKPGEFGEGAELVQPSPLNCRWQTQAPLIIGSRVIVAAPESEKVVCLDLLTGNRVWERDRENLLAVEGAHGPFVLMVDQESVRALRVADGSVGWTAHTGPIAGRGVVTGGQLYLPVVNVGIRRLNLSDGAVTGEWRAHGDQPVLGHLSMYEGMVLANGPYGLTAFAQADAIRGEITRRKQSNPDDRGVLWLEARVAAIDGNAATAAELLAKIREEELAPSDRDEFRRLRFRAALTFLDQSAATLSEADRQARFERLRTLAVTTADEFRASDLIARDLARRGDVKGAVALYASLASRPVEMLRIDANGEAITMSSDAWLAGRLADLELTVPQDQRGGLRSELEQFALAIAADASLAEWERRAGHLSGLTGDLEPIALELRFRLAERAIAAKEFAMASRWLLPLADHSRPAVAARSGLMRAELCLSFDLIDDAADEAAVVAKRFAGESLEDGGKVADAVASLQERIVAARSAGQAPGATAVDWSQAELRMSRVGVNYSNDNRQDLSGLSPLPWYRNQIVDVDLMEQRLQVTSATTGELLWSMPLYGRPNFPEQTVTVAEAAGYTLVILHRGVLHVVSPVDRKLLWAKAVDYRTLPHGYFLSPVHLPPQHLSPQLTLVNRLSNAQANVGGHGALLMATPEIVVYGRQRMLTAVDPSTGAIRWTQAGFRPGTQLFGDGRVVYLRSAEEQHWVALRGCDGRRIDLPALRDVEPQVVQVVGHRMLLLGRPQTPPADAPAKKPVRQLELFDPLTGRSVWSIDSPASRHLAHLEAGRLIRYDSKAAALELIDISSGGVINIGTIPEGDRGTSPQMYAAADRERVYLVVNTRRPTQVMNEQMACLPISGRVLAFDRNGGGLVWRRELSQQSLVLERFANTPVLLFAARRFEQRGKFPNWLFYLDVWDKKTGSVLYSQSWVSNGGYRNLIYEPGRKTLELRSYSDRVRLGPAPVEATAVAPDSTPVPPTR